MRIAINGYGRIGRSFVRALAEREGAGWQAPFTLVAINDKGRPEDLLYLTRYDTTHGRLAEPAELIDGMLRIGKQAPMLLEQPHLRIHPAFGQQLLMRAFFNNPPLLHNQNLIVLRH